MNTAVKTVDDYMNALPGEVREVLQKLRSAIKSVAPKAEEVISYGMPAYKYYGMLVYFAAFKNHCSLFPGSSQIVKMYDELKAYKTSKGTIQFTLEKPLPVSLVKKIVKSRMEENKTRHAAKQILQPVKKKAKVADKKTDPVLLKEAQQVIAYMARLKGKQFEEVDAVRKLIRKSSKKLQERIKWNAPSYYYKEDVVTFGPYKPGKLLLVFHHPAVVKVKSELLQGDYKDRRLVYFKDAKEAEKNKKELARIVNEILKQIA